jgi:hypothetical protein
MAIITTSARITSDDIGKVKQGSRTRLTLATSSFVYLFNTSFVLTIAFVRSFGASTLAFVPACADELTMFAFPV